MRLNLLNRRELMTFVSALAVWSLRVARAQQSENLARIGFLPLGSPSNQHDLSYVEAFRKGLIENGLIEGRNVILESYGLLTNLNMIKLQLSWCGGARRSWFRSLQARPRRPNARPPLFQLCSLM